MNWQISRGNLWVCDSGFEERDSFDETNFRVSLILRAHSEKMEQ